MKFLVGIFLALASCLSLGCPPNPLNPPPDATDAMPAPACQVMCDKLASLQCAEGLDKNCVSTCGHALQDPGVPDPPVACVARAADVAGVQACGMACH